MAQTGAEKFRLWRTRHPERYNATVEGQKIKNWAIKREVLTHYGNGGLACVICGESRIECLSIDHINGGGKKERKELNLSAGIQYYKWLKRNNYPKGYQTLCMNCQFVKRFARGEHN